MDVLPNLFGEVVGWRDERPLLLLLHDEVATIAAACGGNASAHGGLEYGRGLSAVHRCRRGCCTEYYTEACREKWWSFLLWKIYCLCCCCCYNSR